MTDYHRHIEDVTEEEAQNWPKGCNVSTHHFMDVAESPILIRPYYNNEEIHYLYLLRRAELLEQDMTIKQAETQAKKEILPIIYPYVDLVNFIDNNPNMTAKCCRLIFDIDLDRIANFHIVHGESLKFVNNSMNGDVELDIPDDLNWGWDLTKPEEGFPCINLDENGDCFYHVTENKPYRCQKHPEFEKDLHLITTCSYSFDENGAKTGTCNQCKS